jgi:hypothetical protein
MGRLCSIFVRVDQAERELAAKDGKNSARRNGFASRRRTRQNIPKYAGKALKP